MAKILRKTTKRREGRVNGWMASTKAQRNPRAFRKPGSMKHK